jgi:hypothetical protein
MPSNSLSISTVNMWFQVSGTTTEPPASTGQCTFWDNFGCLGNDGSSGYVPVTGVCLPASSTDGQLWKSAKCWNNNGASPDPSTNLAENILFPSVAALSSEACAIIFRGALNGELQLGRVKGQVSPRTDHLRM